MKLVLFDIDGTLLWTDGAGRRAVHRALVAEAGTAGPIDTYRFDGKTDPQIITDLLRLGGHPLAGRAELLAAVSERYLVLLAEELAGTPGATRVLPGVTALLAALVPYEAEDRALVGLLTGNYAVGAALKLRSGGLDPDRFAVGAYGSDSGSRPDLPAIAVRRAIAARGRAFPPEQVVVLGDTPADVACAAGIGARSIGVATGYYDVAALRAAGATAVFESLADTGAVLDVLLG
ncbi:MAG TPA: HAD family hydrolase [Gemmatimonadales bacterium]|nr:HAD family hydrolase [Gemmatimonadales bacterium]